MRATTTRRAMTSNLDDQDARRHPERSIRQDVAVEGLLRLGDGFVVDGDIRAPGGVILGDDVIIQGDIHTDGRVQMGQGSHVQGQIIPISGPATQGRPATGDGPRQAREVTKTAGAREPAFGNMEISTVQATMEILWELVCSEPIDSLGVAKAPLSQLEPRALEEIKHGLRVLLGEAYQVEDEEPWDAEAVISVLLRRVLPLVLTAEATRLGPQMTTVTVPRPTGIHAPPHAPGWPRRARAFLEIMTTAVMPEATVKPTDTGTMAKSINPDEVALEIIFPETGLTPA